ncbi:MAG: hypothetical protein VKJ24_06775 [Synechococcales bacterium]|nr:hypothetical protein [Synechococcales bacterium]
MDHDSEAYQQAFIDLITCLGLNLSSTDTAEANSLSGVSGSAPILPHIEELPLNSGDTPAVQDRFHALLKHRLQMEIQRNPPLYPWEDELIDYPAESLDSVPVLGIKANSLWLAQLRRLGLPVALPDAVLGQLLTNCQTLAQSSLREGEKLIQAVSSLFPRDLLELNHWASLVLMSPARSGLATVQDRLAALGASVPYRYEEANASQQMVLSLLAAQELLQVLTLNVIPDRSSTQEWVTEIGVLTLQLDYRVEAGNAQLRVQGQLPCGGSLQLRAEQGQAFTQCPDAGNLSVELLELRPQQPVVLEVRLGEEDEIAFAIEPLV